MPFSLLRMVPFVPITRLPNTHLSPLLYYVVYCTQFQATKKQSSCGVWLVKNKSSPIGLISPFARIHASQARSADTEKTYDLEDRFKQTLTTDSSEKHTYTDKTQLQSTSQRLIDKRKQKGPKHSAETRARISQKTKAALMDPKIREKMSGRRSHVLSDESKARISKSLTRVWGKRLKWKRSGEKFLSSWAESIAEAAKRGGSVQRELQWDSYDKIKEEIAIEQKRAKEEKMDRFKQTLTTDSSEKHTYTDKTQLQSTSQRLIDKRKLKTGPKHSAETRARISQKTKAALMDPKIREKMSGRRSHVLSDESKARISKSLTWVWGKRLKWKRSGGKFLSSWAESIAEAAKRGGSVQRELQWDSYDKIKEEIAIEQKRAKEEKMDRFKQTLTTDSSEKHTYTDKTQLQSTSQRLIDKRKLKTGPKHSAETRARISQKTKAALMDPTIREKMSGGRRSHVLSDESKARISKSLTWVWGKRLKWKRSGEKFLSSWAESIAEAAKRGGSGQRELQWDSYDKIKEEIAIEQRNQAEERAKEEKMARLARNRKVKGRKATPRGEMRCAKQKICGRDRGVENCSRAETQ